MAKVTQNWVGYAHRSYEQIKRAIFKRLPINNPEMTDHTESNPFVALVSIFAGIAEIIHVYIDNMAREAYLGVARKFTSVVRLSKLVDYRIKARWYASVDLLFTLYDSTGAVTTYNNGNILIPKGTLISSSNGSIVRTLLDVYIISGQSSAYSTAVQYAEVTNAVLGNNTNGNPFQKFLLPDNYVHDSLTLLIQNEFWTAAYSFGLMNPTSQNFVVIIEEDGKAYAVFGDGLNGMIPTPGQTVYANYLTTDGTLGNLPPNSYINLDSIVPLPDTTMQLKVTHPEYASGGSNFESIEDIRKNAPLSLRTLRRAVTYQDYKDVAELEPGVGAAEVKYCCGKFVDIYIIPKSKGIATQALTATVKDSMECKKMITTAIAVKPSGLTMIYIKAKIYAKPLFNPVQVKMDVINALDAEYGFTNSAINKRVVISDIINTMESVPSVDRTELQFVKIKPYARPLEDNGLPLDINFLTLPVSNIPILYSIVFFNGNFQVYKNGILTNQLVAPGGSYADAVVSFQLNAGSYQNGDTWEFKAHPSYPEIFPVTSINIDDFTAPIIDIGIQVDEITPRTIYGDIEVVGQNLQSNCLPPC